MKLFFKIILILSLINISYARDLFLITSSQENTDHSDKIKAILMEDFSIPSKAIKIMIMNKPCIANKDTLLHICITKNEKYILLNKNSQVLQRSFSQFNR